MPRTDYDDVYEKQPDGTMRRVSRVERTVDDEEIARAQALPRLRALWKLRPWTRTEMEEVIVTLIRIIVEREALRDDPTPSP